MKEYVYRDRGGHSAKNNYFVDNENSTISEKEEKEIKSENKKNVSKKSRKKKRKKTKNYLLRIFIFVLIVILLRLFFGSFIFDVEKINIEGLEKYPEQEVLEMSKMKVGENIFSIKDRKGLKSIIELPYIKEAKVSRKLPDEIVLKVEEREPLALVPYNDKYLILDKEMCVLELGEKKEGIALIENVKLKKGKVGEKVESNDEETLEKTLDIIELGKKEGHVFNKVELELMKKTKTVNVNINISLNLAVKGKYENVEIIIEKGYLKEILFSLDKKKIERGTLLVDDDLKCTFSPEIQ